MKTMEEPQQSEPVKGIIKFRNEKEKYLYQINSYLKLKGYKFKTKEPEVAPSVPFHSSGTTLRYKLWEEVFAKGEDGLAIKKLSKLFDATPDELADAIQDIKKQGTVYEKDNGKLYSVTA